MVQIKIEKYQANYATEILDVFHAAIHAIDPEIYTKKQQEAWCAALPDDQKWIEHSEQKKAGWQCFIALSEKTLVGFIELEEDGSIDCLYVHPEFQGRGIATSLYKQIMILAREKGLTSLNVYASEVALPIFKKWGFSTIRINEIERQGEVLINFYMEKDLNRFALPTTV